MYFRAGFRFLVCLMLIAPGADAQESAAPNWLTGESLQRQLDSQIGIAWSSEPLRQKLKSLSEHTRVAIWLDRRIDPSQQPELSIADTQLSRCFELIGEHLQVGVCYVGPVVYFGPRTLTTKLATAAELRGAEAGLLPAEVRTKLTRPIAWSWESLTTPRELLDRLEQESGLKFHATEQIPHDLWDSARLPPLSFTDRLSLVLAGFDLTFQFDAAGKNLRLVPIPEQVTLSRGYSVRGDVAQALAQLRSALPQVDLMREGARIVAIGRSEEHQAIARLLAGEKQRTSTAGQPRTVYSMKGPSMLGTVLKTLQVQAGLNISLDAKAEERLRDRVAFEVNSVSLHDLLTAVLRDTGLQFELNGKNLKVFAP